MNISKQKFIEFLYKKGFYQITSNNNPVQDVLQKIIDNYIVNINIFSFPKCTITVYENAKLLENRVSVDVNEIMHGESVGLDMIELSIHKIFELKKLDLANKS